MSVTVWVVDDDRSIRWVLEKALSQEGYAVTCFEDGDEALNTLEEGGQEPEVLISDVRMPGTDGLRMLKILQRKNPDLPVIIMTAHSDLDSAVASYQGGAFEYLPKPFDLDEAVDLVHRALENVEHPGWEQQLETVVQRKLDLGQSGILDEIGPQFERVLLQTALSFTHGRKQEAARRLGWGRNTLTRKLKELKLD